jgi:DNA-binding NarL/FixJ family response regulator
MLEAMALAQAVGDRWSAAVLLDLLGGLAARHKQGYLSAQLFGAAEALREAIQAPLAPGLRDLRVRYLRAAQDLDRPEVFARGLQEGRALALETALAMFEAAQPAATTQNGSLGELTSREIEVLRLVAEGLTDANIAERLVVSVRTVHAHLRSIYAKLDVTTRTAAARWAMAHGFLTQG